MQIKKLKPMEVIDVGSISVERVLEYILRENHLKKLVRYNSTACFVLAHQMLNPKLYESLIENSDTIDATTREFIDFIIFYGNKSGIAKVNRKRRYPRRERIRIEGLSLYSQYEPPTINLPEKIEYNSALADELRYKHDNILHERYLSHQMTRGATILMDFFNLDDSSLPCLLFVNPNNLNDFFSLKIDVQNPISSIYSDILKPISIFFHELKEYSKLKRSISLEKEEISNAEKNKIELPKKININKKQLNQIKLKSNDLLSELEKEKYAIEIKYKKFKSEIQKSDVRKIEIDYDLKDDPNSIVRLNLVLERIRSLEAKKKDIETGKVNFNSDEHKQMVIAKNLTNLNKDKHKLKKYITRIEKVFSNDIGKIEVRMQNEKSEELKLLENIQRMEKKLYEAQEKLTEDSLKKTTSKKQRFREITSKINKAGFEKEVYDNHNFPSYGIIKSLFTQKKLVSKKKFINQLTRDLFICHASSDKKQYVSPLTDFLRSKNISIWYDESEIHWGDSIIKKVNEGLRISKYVLVVLSKNTIDRNWQNSEIEASLNSEFSAGKTRVLPLVIGRDEEIDNIMSYYPILASKVYIKYSKGFGFIYKELKERLGN